MYKALDVANYIINKENESKRKVTYIRLQVLMYFARAEFLIANNDRCFEEDMYAKHYGILINCIRDGYFGRSGNLPTFTSEKQIISKIDCDILDRILEETAKYDTEELRSFIKEQYPYKQSINNGKAIKDKDMIMFFGEKEYKKKGEKLVRSIISGNYKKFYELIISAADPHYNECMPFKVAIIHKRYAMLKAMINNGFDITKEGDRCINFSIRCGDLESIKLMHKSLSHIYTKDLNYLINSLYHGKLDIAEYFLKEYENNEDVDMLADVLNCNTGFMADKEKRYSIVKNLIENV